VRTITRRTFVKQSGLCVGLGELLLSGEKMAYANPLGLPNGCQTWPMSKMIAKDFPGTLKQLAAAGFQSTMVDGQRTYDLLFKLLDPIAVKFQFQVSTIAEGFDASEYFTKYPGRFISMHVQGWSAKTRSTAPVGQVTLDWKKIFAAPRTGGIKNCFVCL
jgi:hypothetical protein